MTFGIMYSGKCRRIEVEHGTTLEVPGEVITGEPLKDKVFILIDYHLEKSKHNSHVLGEGI